MIEAPFERYLECTNSWELEYLTREFKDSQIFVNRNGKLFIANGYFYFVSQFRFNIIKQMIDIYLRNYIYFIFENFENLLNYIIRSRLWTVPSKF